MSAVGFRVERVAALRVVVAPETVFFWLVLSVLDFVVRVFVVVSATAALGFTSSTSSSGVSSMAFPIVSAPVWRVAVEEAFVAVTLPLLILFAVVLEVSCSSPSRPSSCTSVSRLSFCSSEGSTGVLALVLGLLVTAAGVELALEVVAALDEGLDALAFAAVDLVAVLAVDVDLDVDVNVLFFLLSAVDVVDSSTFLPCAAARARVTRLGGEAGAFAGARGAILDNWGKSRWLSVV